MKVTLWRQDVRIERPLRAASELHDRRSRLFLAVDHSGVVGYGEIAPQPHALNGDPGVDDVIDELVALVLPQLNEIVSREGDVPSWSRAARLAGPRAASNPAVALVEMALLDRELRAGSSRIDDLWTQRFETPLQTSVSLLDDEEWAIGPDIARVRVKTGPGALSARSIERLSTVKVPVLLDFNCSANNDAEVIEQIESVGAACDLVGVEQPYAVGNVIDQARLAERVDVALSIDEGLRSLRDLAALVRYRAASIVCVKPARVGGLANARTLVAKATEAGLRPYIGGFFESPYARHVNRWLAGSCVVEPSDLSPVSVVLDGYDEESDEDPRGYLIRPSPTMLAHCTVVTSVV